MLRNGVNDLKALFLAILGVITGWILWGVITDDFEFIPVFLLVLGISIGYSIGKKEGT
ncbi:tRNA U-34 5-methylaminomethyl-2-thiouridine biosynthesis protein [Rossellomorea vietnamensis]|uniref:tRNA U-34 5-methylaminomethyl-2-thiouridine biosynthesis protein n=1 Tax=Rossellomorea vietnamensis TaxID=218284 RepID=UPI003CEFB0D1